MANSKPSQAQVREINRTLLATVRADWKFPDERPARQNFHNRSADLEPPTFRERYYGLSDEEEAQWESTSDEDESEEEDEAEEDGDILGISTVLSPIVEQKPKEKSSRKASRRPKFDSPDTVADELDKRIKARVRRRRYRAVTEEMKYNTGLCFFTRRRNAWTGAVTHETAEAHSQAKDTFLPTSTDSKEFTSKESSEEVIEEAIPSDADSSLQPSATHDSGIALTSVSVSPSPFDPPTDPSSLIDVLVPIVGPFLPDSHSVRASIMARSDSELYEKIVRDSRTPAVPINLAHMMRVIVQGWKDEGNWPPKGAALLAEQGGLLALRNKRMSAAQAPGEVHRGIFAGHRHLQKGVDSVKRALRLSGSGPPTGD